MSRKPPPEISHAAVLEYWRLVRAELVRLGLSNTRAARVAARYRKFMKPAGWTVYNGDPKVAAGYAVNLAAGQQSEGDQ